MTKVQVIITTVSLNITMMPNRNIITIPTQNNMSIGVQNIGLIFLLRKSPARQELNLGIKKPRKIRKIKSKPLKGSLRIWRNGQRH